MKQGSNLKRPARKLFRLLACLAGCLAGCLALTACMSPPGKRDLSFSSTDIVNRADPGYIQYMGKLAMLEQSAELASLVSGSNLGWRRGGSEPAPQDLLGLNDVWLRIHPQTVLVPGHNSPLGQLGGPIFWSSLQKAHIGGLYLSPLGGAGGLWDYEAGRSYSGNDDVAQYALARHIGSEEDYLQVLRGAAANQGFTGSALIPAAPGVGPDFFLAVRDVRTYPGLYCLVEVPREKWNILDPVAPEEWRLDELSPSQRFQLEQQGVIPASLRQDQLDFLDDAGWAATSQVRGMDGQLRRWAYRYYGDRKRPVLNVADPSGAARQVQVGSVVLQVGKYGNALNGYSVAPFIGLERQHSENEAVDMHNKSLYSQALSVSLDLSRQTRSYGGWSWLTDQLPLPVLQMIMESGPDFVMDSVTSPAAEHALLSGDTSVLRFMLQEALDSKLDFSRLVHYSAGHEGISYRLPHLQYLRGQGKISTAARQKSDQAAALYRATLEQAAQPRQPMPKTTRAPLQPGVSFVPANNAAAAKPAESTASAATDAPALQDADFEKGVLYQTPVGLAAAALGLATDSELSAEDKAEIRKGHELLLAFKAVQPGLLMLSGQDLTGTFPLNWTSIYDIREEWKKPLASLGTYALQSNSRQVLVNSLGLPQARMLYGPIDEQSFKPDSFLNSLGELIKLRRELGLAQGRMAGLIKGRNSSLVCLVNEVAEQDIFVLALFNFTRQTQSDELSLSGIPGLEAAWKRNKGGEEIRGDSRPHRLNGPRLPFTLNPWEYSIILVKKGK